MQFEVLPEEAGLTLLSFLRKRYQGPLSVKALKRAVEGKKCRINGRTETFSTYKLKAKDRVVLEGVEVLDTKPDSLSILYEDDYFFVCNKPAGVICEPGKFPLKGRLVHRLDKETSGALIVAKHSQICEAFEALFVKGLVSKEYLALVDGEVKGQEGHIENFLVKKHAYQGQTIYGSSPTFVRGSKKAITNWRKVKTVDKATLLLCYPITGRTHQLRVHLKEMGHPILGDYQYARRFTSKLSPRRHLLHAWRLSFPHPVSGEKIEIRASLPKDFLVMLEGFLDAYPSPKPQKSAVEELMGQILLL